MLLVCILGSSTQAVFFGYDFDEIVLVEFYTVAGHRRQLSWFVWKRLFLDGLVYVLNIPHFQIQQLY